MKIKKTVSMALLVTTTLITTGCAQRIADLTLASTKNINLNAGNFAEGNRVIGEDSKPIILFPLGIPSIKEATDRAIEQDRCAVGLTDVSADSEFFRLSLAT